MLVAKGFAVRADYTYGRDAESGERKDFSVDLHATGYAPFSDPDQIDGVLELLIECKYRLTEGTKWLFLPDVNKPGFSNIYLGCAVRSFEEFSKYRIDKNPSYEFTKRTPCCYKGIEVQGGSQGGVHESELRHGIEQLRYALPMLVRNAILNTVTGHPDDNRPFIVCPILLTNAELYVIHKNVGVARVRAADDVAQLGKPVPYLITYSGYGPDFERHCRKTYRVLKKFVDHEEVRTIDTMHRITTARGTKDR